MKNLLLVMLLTASTSVLSAEMVAKFPQGTIVAKDSICTLSELVDDFPYDAYAISKSGVMHQGCWKRIKGSSPSMINFIEKTGKDRYEYNKIFSSNFK